MRRNVVHDYDSQRQTGSADFALRRSSESRVNGSADWEAIRRTYSRGVVEHYCAHRFADRGVKFSQMLERGLARSVTARHGRYREFVVDVRIYENALPDPKRPWLHQGRKRRFRVHPEDDHFYQRILERARVETQIGMRPENRDVVARVYDTSTTPPRAMVDDATRPASKHVMGQLMQAEPYRYAVLVARQPGYAHVEIASGLLEPFVPEHARPGARAEATKIAEPLVAPRTRSSGPLAETMCDLIACEMCKQHAKSRPATKKHARKLIRDQAFVSRAVEAVIMNDELYRKHGAKNAADFWHSRRVNIGELINDVTHAVSTKTAGIDTRSLFARIGSALDEPLARKAFHAAAIQDGLWERFKQWTDYHGTAYDDGGPDLGPSASLSLSLARGFRSGAHLSDDTTLACLPVHEHACRSRSPDGGGVLEERLVMSHGTEDHERTDGLYAAPSVPSAAIHRLTGHAGHRKGHGRGHAYCCSQDEFSASSDEETTALKRALHPNRRPRSSDSSSDDDGDDAEAAAATDALLASDDYKYLRDVSFGNFLAMVRRAYPDGKLPASGTRPCVLILAPPDSVFTRENMARVIGGVREHHKTYRDFVHHYLVPLENVEQFDRIAACQNTLKLVSMSGVIYTVVPQNRTLQLKEGCARKFKPGDPRLRFGGTVCMIRGFPANVRACQLLVLHHNFPRETLI